MWLHPEAGKEVCLQAGLEGRDLPAGQVAGAASKFHLIAYTCHFLS
jgi:hypothetical protein